MVMDASQASALGASKPAISHHYDLSNEFYRLWLDAATMSYTCALYGADESEEALEEAQIRKIDHHIEQAGAHGAQRVLDIGCGWGNVLRRLTEVHGVQRAVGLTLSQEQAAWIGRAGDGRTEVHVQSWADHVPDAPYDAILSIEAFEAFARPGLSAAAKVQIYGALFERCRAWLRPGGRMSLQTIAYGNSGPGDLDTFISDEIFPESDLPRLSEVAEAIERRFELVSLRNDRLHYARTLRAWLRRLKRNRGRAVELVGEETVSRYEQYLRLSMYMFESGACGLLRMTLQRIDKPRPLRARPEEHTDREGQGESQ